MSSVSHWLNRLQQTCRMRYDHLLYRWFQLPPRLVVTTDLRPASPALHTIILIHGIASSSKTWDNTITAIRQAQLHQNCRIITLDLLGFGKSPKYDFLNYHYPDYLTALHRTLKKLGIKTPITLVGHSMGSLIATRYASLHSQVKNLILVSGPVIRARESAKLSDRLYKRAYVFISKNIDEARYQKLVDWMDKATSFSKKDSNTPAFERAIQTVVLDKDNFTTIVKLKIPITMIHGKLDPLVFAKNLELVTQKNSHARLITTAGSHDINSQKIHHIIKTIQESLNL